MGRRILVILLSAALLLSLAGCTLLEKPDSKEADKARLRGLLDQVAENIKEAQPPITAALAADFVPNTPLTIWWKKRCRKLNR